MLALACEKEGLSAPDDAGTDRAAASFCVETTPSCEPATDVADAPTLYAAMVGLSESEEWSTTSSPASTQVPSRDFRATVDNELDVPALRAALKVCDPSSGSSCAEPKFAAEKPFHSAHHGGGAEIFRLGDTYPPGVSCVQPSPGGKLGCWRVKLVAGTVVRFQRAREIFQFGGAIIHRYVRIVRGCDVPCAPDETRCAASSLCLKRGKDYCVLCEDKREVECACREGCGTKPEGAYCSAITSDDTQMSGGCAAGECDRRLFRP
jgi:hypothetical protein